MNLAYQIYSQVASQLQMTQTKMQEAKPAFAVLEPATVPLQPSGTSRKMILMAVTFRSNNSYSWLETPWRRTVG